MRLTFYKPGALSGQAVAGQGLDYQRLLPEGVMSVTRSEEGYILSEELGVNGFCICSHVIQLVAVARVEFFTGRLGACLQAVLEGGFQMVGPGVHAGLWENTYQLQTLSEGNHYSVYIKPGRHHVFQVEYPVSLIEKLGVNRQAVTAPDAGPYLPLNTFTQSLDISRAAQRIISRILQRSGVVPLPVIRLNHDCLTLLQVFFEQLSSKEQAEVWEAGKTGRIGEVELFIQQGIGDHKLSNSLGIHFGKRWKVTAYQFQRLVRKASGMSVSSLIHTRRMEKALTMIETERLAVSDVSITLGYGDVSSFSRAFRSFYGHPPSHYQRP